MSVEMVARLILLAVAVILLFFLAVIYWALRRQNDAMRELLGIEDRGLFFRGSWRMMHEFPGPLWDPRAKKEQHTGDEPGSGESARGKGGNPEFSEEECVRRFRAHYLSGVRRYARTVSLVLFAAVAAPVAGLLVIAPVRSLLWATPPRIALTCAVILAYLSLFAAIMVMVSRGAELIFKVEGKMALLMEPPEPHDAPQA